MILATVPAHRLQEKENEGSNNKIRKHTDAFEMTFVQRGEIILIATQTTVDEQMAQILIRIVVPSVVVANTRIMVSCIPRLIATLWPI